MMLINLVIMCRTAPGTLLKALRLLYLDELRLFGLLCFTQQSVTTEFGRLQDEE